MLSKIKGLQTRDFLKPLYTQFASQEIYMYMYIYIYIYVLIYVFIYLSAHYYLLSKGWVARAPFFLHLLGGLKPS